MKTTIISTLFAIFLFIAGNVNSYGQDTKQYKNVSMTENTITTEIYSGNPDKRPIPLAKHVIKYSEIGYPLEKIIYRWNSNENKWIETCKYKYHHDYLGNISVLEYQEWNKLTKDWNSDPYFTMYIRTNEGELLTINK